MTISNLLDSIMNGMRALSGSSEMSCTNLRSAMTPSMSPSSMEPDAVCKPKLFDVM